LTYPLVFQRHVRRLVERLRHDFFLGEYAYSLEFTDAVDSAPGYIEGASIVIDPTYLEFKIRIRPLILDYWKAGNHSAIGRVLAHEMAHVITQPLYLLARHESRQAQDLEEIRERQTQRVANAILDKMPSGWYLPEKGRKCRRQKR
jgi:hypothetical protein